jgi:predicted AlkP superfamily phosphohydrolase/phosphomutase
MTMNTKTPPLVILGLDAGDFDFIQCWAQEGHLPTIASIMKQGCWGRTAGPELITEHGVWVSLFTGVSTCQHGYYYFRQLKPRTYDLETITWLDLDVLPFWDHLRGQSKKVAIIDVPENRPIRGLPGLQLANWAIHDSWDPRYFTTSSEPPELLQEVHQDFGPKLTSPEKHKSTFREDLQIYGQLVNHVKKKGALCRHLLARDCFDLVVIVFSESHAANHQFWKYRSEVHNGVHVAENELTHAIRSIYQAIDREMGLLLAQLPRESNVIIMSSVGMEDDFPTTGLIEAFCRQLGYQAPPESSRVSFRPIDLIRCVLPEAWRIALSRHLPRERRERLLADQFRNGTNWRKTTAFAIPAAYTSFVRVNLRGREPEGIVEPGAEYEALLGRIMSDLKQLIDPQTNEPAVKRVAKTVELFGCDPPASLPDLFVEWKPGRFMQRVVHPRAELVQQRPDFYRRSDHSSNGFVAAAGPFISNQRVLGEVQVLDLVPTFLSLIGEPVPQSMTGKVIEAMIRGRA